MIKINAIDVPADAGEEVAKRFAHRAHSVDGAPGFEGFELFRPTDDRTTWLVVTRWKDQASFDAWRNDPSFEQAHARPEGAPQPPVAMKAELWSYEVALDAGPK